MATTKLPYEKNLVASAGATFRCDLHWTAGEESVDLSDWDAWMPLGSSIDTPLQELTIENNELSVDSDGFIKIELSPERTLELSLLDVPTRSTQDGRTGTLFYNLTLKDPLGRVWRLMRGKLFIEHDVQRPI